MTTLNRLVVEWSGGGIVGRAVSVLHFDGSDNAAPPVAAVRAAFNAGKDVFISGVTLSFPTAGDRIDSSTGDLVGTWSAPVAANVVSAGAGSAAAGVGACITWYTGGIVTGLKGPRKLRGRTFLVPLAGGAYDAQGKINATGMGLLESIATGLQGAGPLAVWHRPTSATSTDGNSYGVIAHKIGQTVAFLGSRKH